MCEYPPYLPSSPSTLIVLASSGYTTILSKSCTHLYSGLTISWQDQICCNLHLSKLLSFSPTLSSRQTWNRLETGTLIFNSRAPYACAESTTFLLGESFLEFSVAMYYVKSWCNARNTMHILYLSNVRTLSTYFKYMHCRYIFQVYM